MSPTLDADSIRAVRSRSSAAESSGRCLLEDDDSNGHEAACRLPRRSLSLSREWVWVPPRAVLTNELVEPYEPGYWIKETTAGCYYPMRWALQETSQNSAGCC